MWSFVGDSAVGEELGEELEEVRHRGQGSHLFFSCTKFLQLSNVFVCSEQDLSVYSKYLSHSNRNITK